MTDNFFDGLGGFMKGLSPFMPQDDPDTKVFQTMSELNDLQKRETELYAEIGKKVFPSISGNPDYASFVTELQQNQSRQAKAQEQLRSAKQEKEEKTRREEEELAARTCPNCGTMNPEGIKFCQECGTKLGQPNKAECPKCGMKNPPQTRFCGECGTKLI